MEKFKNQLIKNLENNGFPQKRVAFNIETIYQKCEDAGLSFNNLRPFLREDGIESTIETERVIFSKIATTTNNQDKMKEAQDMMSNMDPQELEKIQNMFENMSEDEKNNLMQEAKKMGLL